MRCVVVSFVRRSQAFAKAYASICKIRKGIRKKFASIRNHLYGIIILSISPGQSYNFRRICREFQMFIFARIFATVWEQHKGASRFTPFYMCATAVSIWTSQHLRVYPVTTHVMVTENTELTNVSATSCQHVTANRVSCNMSTTCIILNRLDPWHPGENSTIQDNSVECDMLV
jgi:hypothetical protein